MFVSACLIDYLARVFVSSNIIRIKISLSFWPQFCVIHINIKVNERFTFAIWRSTICARRDTKKQHEIQWANVMVIWRRDKSRKKCMVIGPNIDIFNISMMTILPVSDVKTGNHFQSDSFRCTFFSKFANYGVISKFTVIQWNCNLLRSCANIGNQWIFARRLANSLRANIFKRFKWLLINHLSPANIQMHPLNLELNDSSSVQWTHQRHLFYLHFNEDLTKIQ